MTIKVCCICKCESPKYKCPKCKQLYCSVKCCNKHKENCSHTDNKKTENSKILETSEKEEDSSKSNTAEYEFSTEDTVPLEKLDQLRYSEEVKNCLKNPQVRDIIKFALLDKDPTNAIAVAMTEPVFVEFADACLKVVERSDEEKPC